MMAASGSGYGGGGCYCPKADTAAAGGLGDIGLLAAAAAATFLLYTAITMMMRRRRRRSEILSNGEEVNEFIWLCKLKYI